VNTLTPLAIQNIRRFYYASTYETMQRIRRLTTVIKDTNPNTVILFTSDHGFSLGEHAFWAKHRMYRQDVRVPMEVSIPLNEFTAAGHVATDAQGVASLMDIVPTAMDWLGYPMQACDQYAPMTGEWCSDGKSMLPASREIHGLSNNHDTRSFKPFGEGSWSNSYGPRMVSARPQQSIYSVYPRNRWRGSVREVVLGHTIYYESMRLTFWVPTARDISAVEAARLTEPRHTAEMYNHTHDPLEMHNIYDPTNPVHIRVTEELRRLAEQGSCPVAVSDLSNLRTQQIDQVEINGFVGRLAMCANGNWNHQTTPPTTLSSIMDQYDDFTIQFASETSDEILRWRVHDDDSHICILNDNSRQHVYYIDSRDYVWFQRVGIHNGGAGESGGAAEPVACEIGNQHSILANASGFA
jgi:hypothetical protein